MCVSAENDMKICINKAYESSIKQYHNWIIKRVFSIAMLAVPTKDELLQEISLSLDDFLTNKNLLESQVKEEMISTAKALDVILLNIKEFYIKNNLDC